MKQHFTGLLRMPLRAMLYAALVLTAGLYSCTKSESPAPAPAFTSLNPSSQLRGQPVTIVGTNFNATTSANTVTIGGVSATVSSATATAVVFTVPQTANTGAVLLTTGGTQVSCGTLTVLQPGATALSPTSQLRGQSVTIVGSNFSDGVAANSVTVNGTSCTVTSATANQVVFTVATVATTGTVLLTTGGTQVNAGTLTVLLPTVTSINPTSQFRGQRVTITGTNFNPSIADNSVTVNGTACTINAVGNNQVEFTVAAAATTGTVQLTASGTVLNAGTLTVLIPTVSNVTPTTAAYTEYITLTGTNFSTTTSQNTLTFIGSTTPTISIASATATATQLVFAVPMTAATGAISLNSNGNVVPCGNFTVSVRTVSTFAGSGTSGFSDNSSPTAAQFANPFSGVFDASGNMYVADAANNRIRRIAAGSGAVTTYAGNGTAGNVNDANPLLAQFNNPLYLAIDAAGNLYVSEPNTQSIRRIAAGGGAVTTYAGTGVSGFADAATATAAQFNGPTGLAIDASGNLFVADQLNQRIRRIAAGGGAVTTYAGSGTQGFADNATATSAQFNTPAGLAIDASGNVFVADRTNSRIRRIAAGGGAVTTVAGSGSPGLANNLNPLVASFNQPNGLAIDASGNVYVAEFAGNGVRRIAANGGAVTSYAGTGVLGFNNGAGSVAQFAGPRNLVLDASGNIHVFDTGNFRIRRITP